jgi:hypothetical protein
VAEREVTRIVDSERLALITVKRVCKPCNTGWMHQIEDAAKPVLTRPIQGNPKTLRDDELLAASRWAYLKGLVADLVMNPTTRVPSEAFAWFKEHQRPPRSVLITLSCYGGNRHPLYASTGPVRFDVQVGSGERNRGYAYLLSLGVGHLVVKVLGHHLPFNVDFKPGGRNIGRSHVIWPQPDGPVRWPPRIPLTDNDLFDFAQSP